MRVVKSLAKISLSAVNVACKHFENKVTTSMHKNTNVKKSNKKQKQKTKQN